MQRELGSVVDLRGRWRAWVDALRTDAMGQIDLNFTDDGAGNGWLVLSAKPTGWVRVSRFAAFQPPAQGQFWNILSPLYNDRATVVKRVESYHDALGQAAELPYGDALRKLRGLVWARVHEPADGPWAMVLAAGEAGDFSRLFAMMVRLAALRDAVRVMIVLNQHHSLHGVYPDSLAALKLDSGRDLPIDPFCGAPFGYRLTPAGGYCLYSRGIDGKDDGGGPHERAGYHFAFGDNGDDIYTWRRIPDTNFEPIAVPIEVDPAQLDEFENEQ
jgi:hypothetical protein